MGYILQPAMCTLSPPGERQTSEQGLHPPGRISKLLHSHCFPDILILSSIRQDEKLKIEKCSSCLVEFNMFTHICFRDRNPRILECFKSHNHMKEIINTTTTKTKLKIRGRPENPESWPCDDVEVESTQTLSWSG